MRLSLMPASSVKLLCSDIWFKLCEFSSYLSRRPQCDGTVCWDSITVCDFLHICCLDKWQSVNDDAVLLIVRCLSVVEFCWEIITIQSPILTKKLDSAFSVFSLKQPMVSISDDHDVVHIMQLIEMADYDNEASCHSNLHKSHTPTLTSARLY